METLEDLIKLIRDRLIAKSGNVKLSENIDIIDYANRIGISENQLLFKILEIEETINWSEIEEMKEKRKNSTVKDELSTGKLTSSLVTSTSDVLHCSVCNAVNERGKAKYCLDCGAVLNQPPPPMTDVSTSVEQRENIHAPQNASKSSFIPVLVILSFSVVVLIFGYFFWGKHYLRDKNAPRLFNFASSLSLRSSPASGVDYNFIGNIPYGSELLVYDSTSEWVNCKVNEKEGYAARKFLLNKVDFQELNAIFADEDTRKVISNTRFRKALLSYYKDHNIIGKMDEVIQNEIYGTVSTKEVWLVYANTATNFPNNIFNSKKSMQNSKITDFACIIKNVSNNQRKIILFSFDENETPRFEGEKYAPLNGYISNIFYSYNEFGNIEWYPEYVSF